MDGQIVITMNWIGFKIIQIVKVNIKISLNIKLLLKSHNKRNISHIILEYVICEEANSQLMSHTLTLIWKDK